MSRWDGMFPLFWGIDDPQEQQAHLATMVAAVQAMRPDAAGPFDVVVSGETPVGQSAQTAERIAGYESAGATWWLESLNPERSNGERWPYERLCERVLAGPLG